MLSSIFGRAGTPAPTPWPTPVVAPPPVQPPKPEWDGGLSDILMSEVNLRRSKSPIALPLLRRDDRLVLAAQRWSKWQAENHTMTHGNPGAFQERAEAAGYPAGWLGENVAYGQPNVAEVVEDWMNSPGHRRNILNQQYVDFGAAAESDESGRLYWTMLAGSTKY